MKALRIILFAIAVSLCAGLASAQINKEATVLCSGNGTSCTTTDALVNWNQDTYVEFSINDATGCPANATYQIMARNSGSDLDILITTLSLNGVRSQVFIPLQWYRDWRVVPSDITGCTSLIIVINVVRPPVQR